MKTALFFLLSAALVSAEPLFNGKDLTGWTADVPSADGKPDTPASFIVRNGMLVSLGEPRGHLLTDKPYSHYSLELQYRFPGKGGNCGVLIHASAPRVLHNMYPKSIEVQMLTGHTGEFWCIGEDIQVPHMDERRPRKDGQKWGGGAGDARQILTLVEGAEKPLGEWNTMVIETKDTEIKVTLNGIVVNNGSSCTATIGKIALQAEGAEVEFRKIELTPL